MLGISNKLCANLAFFLLFAMLVIETKASHVDYSYCKKYTPDLIDKADYRNEKGLPLLYMGETFDKKYYITTINTTTDFFEGAFYMCQRFGLALATIKTACEYGIIESWFFDHFPTEYSCWIAGMRFGWYFKPIWMTTGEPLDFSQFGLDVNFIQGPYPPGGYSPIVYPWDNCLSVSRNCFLFTGGPTNPCEQTPTYPELQFMWNDCREASFRVICEETSNTRMDEDEDTRENYIGYTK